MGLCPLGEVLGRMRWRSAGGVCMHGNKSQAGVGGRDTGEKGGGVSGVRLGDDGTLTSCGRFKQGGGVYKKWVWVWGGVGCRYTALAGVGTVSEHF